MVAQPFSAAQSMEANANISDANGNLLFYVSAPNQAAYNFKIMDSNHNIMPNGDSINGYCSATNDAMIVPFPDNPHLYYIFTTKLTTNAWNPTNYFPYYSVVDMSLNSGLGNVTSKNSLLLNAKVTEKIALTKHGNGRDWWLVMHDADSSLYYTFLIDSTGIHNPLIQSIGINYNYSNNNLALNGMWGEMVFSHDGSKLCNVNLTNLDYFNFDRCTGELSNYINLFTPHLPPILGANWNYSCEFSPNDHLLYVTTNFEIQSSFSHLYQFDLTATPIVSHVQTISSISVPVLFGQLESASDRKIYIATGYATHPNYIFDSTSMFLSTIEHPDSLGLACDFHLHGFSLNGHRALMGLPNMPNYNLGALDFPCDSLSSIPPNEEMINSELNIYPNPNSGDFSVAVNSLLVRKLKLLICNSLGQIVFYSENEKVEDNRFIKIKAKLIPGFYFLQLIDENNRKNFAKLIITK